ncbi:unnamed protein product [Aureobasidium uvarum]|uniref:Uncharacterized protein n=1 Tax=Aureobasidium uvarum TaxID=2773716 RepID=A0A9N8KAM5_9PEZI|nr:unnamed protein product [Aureobasidium uvarum]
MTSGPAFQLPPFAIGVLNNIRSDDWSRAGVYVLSSSNISTASLNSICDSLTESYVHDLLGDEQVEDYHQFLTPVLTPFASVQDCIEHHFDSLDKWLLEQPASETHSAVYPHGILVFEKTEQEALLIHVDHINKQWHIGSIYLPIVGLGINLTSLLMGDEFFGDLCNGYNVRVPQNDPNIDENYKDHEKDATGAWKNNAPRFAVFSTGWSHALPVEGMLDDAHEDAPFGHRDVELYSLTGSQYLGNQDKLRAKFPAYVATDQRGEKRHGGKGPCASCRPLHKRIFIEVDNSQPRVDGVLVCAMEWDGNIDGRSDDQLAKIGVEARIVTKRVGVAFAVATAKAIFSNEAERTPKIWQEKS